MMDEEKEKDDLYQQLALPQVKRLHVTFILDAEDEPKVRLRPRDNSLKPARSQSDLVRSASDSRRSSDAAFLHTTATQKRRKV